MTIIIRFTVKLTVNTKTLIDIYMQINGNGEVNKLIPQLTFAVDIPYQLDL
jgi:hypothetical protein